MKIIKLEAENFKRLRAIEITPTGALVVISGANGSGKTSVLDAIWAALAGAKHIQAVPIRRGTVSARIKLDLGELVVERRFTPTGTALTVENAAGARYTTPQTILDALLGALTFDPLSFVTQAPREQFDTLRRLVPLAIDVEQLDGLNRRDHDRRAEINREARKIRAQAEGIPLTPGLPDAPLDTAGLLGRLTEASRTNAELERARARRTAEATEIERLGTAANDRRARAERLRQDAAALDQEAADLDTQAAERHISLATAPALSEPVDAEAIRRELEAAEKTNRGVEQRERAARLLTDAVKLERESQALTQAMDSRIAAKVEAIAAAPMPVPGLGFGDGVVTFEGVPFEQASSAEQLRVSVAIAMAANPKLRVIRIKEGSLLDAENLALIAEMARAGDYQVWCERVDTSGKVGVVIEDGEVAAVNVPAGEGVTE